MNSDTNKEWWEAYFDESWMLMHEYIRAGETTEMECDFLNHLLQENELKTVLDVPSSNGRISVELAARGFEPTAFDFNEKLLDIADKSAVELGVEINTVQGDMRNMEFDEDFDMVACIFGSFGYFKDEGNVAFLESAFKALKPGGIFVLETHVHESLFPVFTPNSVWRFEDTMVVEERVWDMEDGMMKGMWTVFKDGKQMQNSSCLRIYGYKELMAMVKASGFEHKASYGNYYADPFDWGDDQLILHLEKPLITK